MVLDLDFVFKRRIDRPSQLWKNMHVHIADEYGYVHASMKDDNGSLMFAYVQRGVHTQNILSSSKNVGYLQKTIETVNGEDDNERVKRDVVIPAIFD
mgnify:CR=1 FL=1